jgi:hypothetical protein
MSIWYQSCATDVQQAIVFMIFFYLKKTCHLDQTTNYFQCCNEPTNKWWLKDSIGLTSKVTKVNVTNSKLTIVVQAVNENDIRNNLKLNATKNFSQPMKAACVPAMSTKYQHCHCQHQPNTANTLSTLKVRCQHCQQHLVNTSCQHFTVNTMNTVTIHLSNMLHSQQSIPEVNTVNTMHTVTTHLTTCCTV